MANNNSLDDFEIQGFHEPYVKSCRWGQGGGGPFGFKMEMVLNVDRRLKPLI